MRVLVLSLVVACVVSACRAPRTSPAPDVASAPSADAAVPANGASIESAPANVDEHAMPAPAIVPSRVLDNDAIMICGRRVHTGAPVVLWTDAPYYDATKAQPRFANASDAKAKLGPRYLPGRMRVTPNPEFVPAPSHGEADERTALQREASVSEPVVPKGSLDDGLLAEVIDQFVLHYDVCGLSRTCFRVLQDERMLSVQFMLDVDGTIYQTMDVRDTAWHATKSNPRSIGVEIANMGAYPAGRSNALDDWYREDTRGPYIAVPTSIQETGIRTSGFVGRPARGPERIVGVVQGERLEQYDFTPEQYDSLVKLAAVLCRELPKINADAPRDANGKVLDRAMDDEEWRDFHGILGHYHVQKNKTDPGPAFDWEPFLERVRARLVEIRQAGG